MEETSIIPTAPANKTVLVIRHAQSIHNAARKAAFRTERAVEVQFDKQYKDSELSELGYKQCEDALDSVKDLKVAVVFTSPLRRAMETAKQLFGNHPNKPKIEVLPEIREGFTDAGDVPTPWTGELEKRYPEFDFSRMHDFGERKPLWYVELCEEALRKELYELIDRKDAETMDERDPSDIIIDEMVKIEPTHIETDKMMMERALKVRKMLEARAAELKEDEKIVVVAHGHFLYFLIAPEFDVNGTPQQTKFLANCEFCEFAL